MKESKTHIERPKRVIFSETFADEQSVRRNGGTPTNVTFSKGVGEFNGTSSEIEYPSDNLGTAFSIRIIFNLNTVDVVHGLMGNLLVAGDREYIGVTNTNLLRWRNSDALVSDGGTALELNTNYEAVFVITDGAQIIYLNGISDGTGARAVTKWDWVVIGNIGDNDSWYSGNIDLVEIYNYALTAKEVANLYQGKRFHDINAHKEQLGPELIINGTFDEDANWIKGTGWTIIGGKAVAIACSGNLQQDAVGTIGKLYKITYTISEYSSGSVRLVNGAASPPKAADGTYSFYLLASSVNVWMDPVATPFNGKIDNISVKEDLVSNSLEDLNLSAQTGSIAERLGATLTNTATTVVKDSEVNAMSFNGTTSKVDCGVPDTLVGDKTFVAWIKPYSWGEGTLGRGKIISNTKLEWSVWGFTEGMLFRRDGQEASATGAITLNKWQFVVAASDAVGDGQLYVNGISTGPVANNGTPAAGSNIFIGNETTGARAFDGLINDLRIYDGLLSAAEVSQLFSNERAKYNV